MAKVCSKCSKKPSVGHRVSHSNIKTLRRYLPNLVTKRVFDSALGKLVWMKVCTACLRTMVKSKRRRAVKTKRVAAGAAA